MPRKKKAQGEFVWIHFGEHQDTHHAQLVEPMADNPPDDLNDDDSVEIVYTTSMTFAKVSKDSIEYPKQQEEQHQDYPLADDGGHSSPNKISNALSPTRRSSRKRKSMSGTSSSLSSPSLSSSIKKSATKNKSNKTGISTSNRISSCGRSRKKSSEKNDTDLDENRITNCSPRRHQSSKMKKQLHFDSDDDHNDGDEDTESNEAEEDTQDLRNKSKKYKIDDEKMEGQEQSTSLPPSSLLGTLAAPFMGIFHNLFGSGGGNVNKSS